MEQEQIREEAKRSFMNELKNSKEFTGKQLERIGIIWDCIADGYTWKKSE